MLLAFSDGCCPRIDWYWDGRKRQGTFIIQAEKVKGNCYYLNEEGGEWGPSWGPSGIWMCEDSWWAGRLSDKGQCKGIAYASADLKPNVHVQNDSLQWKGVNNGDDYNLNLNCVDLCL